VPRSSSFPTFSLTVVAIAGVAVLTGIARTARLVQARATPGLDIGDAAVVDPSAITVEPELVNAEHGDLVYPERQHA
jgi:hypothetical protein